MSKIKLSDHPTTPPSDLKKKKTESKTIDMIIKIGELQNKLYAEGKQSLLVVLQGMDASGKDGSIKSVFADCNPTGIDTYGFKKPTEEEMAHDFLWRVHQKLPRKGNIMIFNRSHYEDILVQRVHKWIDDERAEKRMRAINAFEDLLQFDNNTRLLKFYMHISYDKQAVELQERIDDPSKNWKHKADDWKEREHWDEYMKCYEYAINESEVPWHIVPSDKRWYRNYFIAKLY
ncbi:MAG: polyphosphate kinase [Chitinophagales bacterium]|nr:polyphosphate kinase [Chitinophagales bacterium]